MGTNYYMLTNACSHCGRADEELHIGKSSAGWCFSLNTHPDEGLEGLDDWREAWKINRIRNEYGETITSTEMMRIITRREWHRRDGLDAEFYAQNQAVPGPNGLLRHAIDGRHCTAHGDGTYDIMRGDFS